MKNHNKHNPIYEASFDKGKVVSSVAAIGLAAGALFLAGCSESGDNSAHHERLLIQCDIGETPSVHTTLATDSESVKAFSISCEGVDELGNVISYSLPGIEVENPSDPQKDTIHFTELAPDEISNPELNPSKTVKFIVDVSGNAENGFDLSMPQLENNLNEGDFLDITVPLESSNKIGETGKVRVNEVKVVDGPGYGYIS